MVLTYQEAVDAGASALRERAIADEARLYAQAEVTDEEWAAALTVSHFIDSKVLCIDGPPAVIAAAVLGAVGYADLLAEVERLRGSADAWWTEYDKELTETGRLQRIVDGYDRTPAEARAKAAEDALAARDAEVERLRAERQDLLTRLDRATRSLIAARAEARIEFDIASGYMAERDALAATLARVERLFPSRGEWLVSTVDLRAALHPTVTNTPTEGACDRGPCHLPRGHDGRCNPGGDARPSGWSAAWNV